MVNLLAQIQNCTFEQQQNDGSCLTTLPQVAANNDTLTAIIQIALAAIAAVTLIFIILTAIRMITSGGESQSVAKARQALIFAGIGLAIVLTAEAIVTLVIKAA